MTVDVVTRECPQGVNEDVERYWPQRLPQIERLLQRIPANHRCLRLRVFCGDIGFTARAVLTLPTGTLVARTGSPVPDHRAAVDQVVDQLIAEIRRHSGHLHQENVQNRKRHRESDFAGAESHLATLHGEQDRDGFFEVLRPLLRHLRSHARRELIIAQLEGIIPPGQLTVADLLDEVLVRAWDRWNDRPHSQPVERWLVGLLHEILAERGFKPPDEKKPKVPAAEKQQPTSIHERLREDEPNAPEQEEDVPPSELNPDSPYSAENGWVAENNPYWPDVDPLTRDEVLPDDQSPEPWQELAAEEERRLILNELSKLPSEPRRAFTLHVLEGWTIREIAEAQGRSPDEVRADIEAVRRALRQRLQEAGA